MAACLTVQWGTELPHLH